MRKAPTCLIVDDMPNIRLVAKQILFNLGCETVLEAPTSEEALRILSECAVDLVLLDWFLPKMSGIDCLRAIRSDARMSHIRCVMMTSQSAKPRVQEAIAAGANGYVLKPFSPRTLAAHLEVAFLVSDAA